MPGSHAGLLHRICWCKLNLFSLAVDEDLPCWHVECSTKVFWRLFSSFYLIFCISLHSFYLHSTINLIVQVEYIDALSGAPDVVKDNTSTFPGKTRVTDCWNTHSGLSPVSLRRTQCRLKAHGVYFLHQNCALWSFYHLAALIPGNCVFFLVLCTSAQCLDLLTLWRSTSRKFKGQGADYLSIKILPMVLWYLSINFPRL